MPKIPFKSGVKASRGLFGILRMGLMFLFLGFLFISIITTAIVEKNPELAIKELGEEFGKPIQKAQETALMIQEQKDQNLVKDIWDYWEFYFQLYKIYAWLWVLHFVVDWLIFPKETNGKLKRWTTAMLLFMLVQTAYSIYLFDTVSNESLSSPWKAIKDIFEGFIISVVNKF